MSNVSLSTNQNELKKMDIGGRVMIEVNCPNGKSAQVSSILIGFKKGQYIFIEYPSATSLEFNKIYLEGADVTFRAITNTTYRDVIAFRTKIHSVIYRPMEMICLYAPSSISMRQIRSYQRIDANFSCKITSNNNSVSGTMVDFSSGGCAIYSPSETASLLNQNVTINVNTENNTNIILHGVVKSIDTKNQLSKIGIMFNTDNIDDSSLQTLHHLAAFKELG